MIGELAKECNAGIIMLTESHLTDEVLDAEVNLEGFETYRTGTQGFKISSVIV